MVKQGPTGDDIAMHEVGKFIRLALKANPTITELLWIPEHEIKTEHGEWLINMRKDFLSRKSVVGAYFGYAKSQLDKFHDKDFKRKHARHCLRLLRQGAALVEHGEMVVKVDSPQEYFDLDDMTNGQVIEILTDEVVKFDSLVSSIVSPLPSVPNRNMASDVLDAIRSVYL